MSTTSIDYLSSLWLQLIEQSGLSDRAIFVLGNTCLVYFLFWPINIILYYSYKVNIPGKKLFLIQPGLQPDPTLVEKHSRKFVFSHLCRTIAILSNI